MQSQLQSLWFRKQTSVVWLYVHVMRSATASETLEGGWKTVEPHQPLHQNEVIQSVLLEVQDLLRGAIPQAHWNMVVSLRPMPRIHGMGRIASAAPSVSIPWTQNKET
jgi:hypothetical protein